MSMDKVVRRVAKRVGGIKILREVAEDVVNHGAMAGFGGFIYSSETVPFGKKIKKYLDLDTAGDELGFSSKFEFLKSFNCLKEYSLTEIIEGYYEKDKEMASIIHNALAWYALEEAARYITEE